MNLIDTHLPFYFLHHQLNVLSELFPRMALFDARGRVIHSSYSVPSDISRAFEFRRRLLPYVKVETGDLLLTNEASVTQSHQFDFALFHRFEVGKAKEAFDLVTFLSVEPFDRLVADDPSLPRVPPLHLLQKYEDHSMILDALEGAYQRNLKSLIEKQMEAIVLATLNLKESYEQQPRIWQARYLNIYLEEGRKLFFEHLEPFHNNAVEIASFFQTNRLSGRLDKQESSFEAEIKSQSWQGFDDPDHDELTSSLIATVHSMMGQSIGLQQKIYDSFSVKSPRVPSTLR